MAEETLCTLSGELTHRQIYRTVIANTARNAAYAAVLAYLVWKVSSIWLVGAKILFWVGVAVCGMERNGWKLPRAARRRTGRAHRGRIQRDVSNERWCSDGLEIACWNGELVQVAFALDGHDREAIAHVAVPRDLIGADIQQLMRAAVAARFGVGNRPDDPMQWLSDNGSIYTALDTLCTAERLHLVPITTPAASPQSNGMSEAFVNTLRRDYLAGADLSTATTVLEQIPAWIADYNAVAPHSALGYQSPQQYRNTQVTEGLTC